MGDSSRRDRLLLLGAMAHAFLTLLAMPPSAPGWTYARGRPSKARQHSLYPQGHFWYETLPDMLRERVATLRAAHHATLREHELLAEILGVIGGEGSGRALD